MINLPEYFCDYSTNPLFYKMSENSPSQFPEAQGDVIECLLLSLQNPKYSVYCDVKQGKRANSHICEPSNGKMN